MVTDWILPLRAVQLVFAIIELGLSAYVADQLNSAGSNTSPSQLNFVIFCAIWSILAVAFFIISPRYYDITQAQHVVGHHKFPFLAVDVVTAIFWFAGFIAWAVKVGVPHCGSDNKLCESAQASVAFGAFLWVLFTATAVLNGVHDFRAQKSHVPNPEPERV